MDLTLLKHIDPSGFSKITVPADVRDHIVWEVLGRMCHLLGDMSVPAHAHNDEHGLNPESYETHMGGTTTPFTTHKLTDFAEKAGLKGMKLHSLRHTIGTYLLAMGYDITVAKDLLGHEDIKTTLVYAKAEIRLLRDAIQSFDALGRNGYNREKGRGETSGGKGVNHK